MTALAELSRGQVTRLTRNLLDNPDYSNKLAGVGRWLTGDEPAFDSIDQQFSESVMEHVQFGINRVQSVRYLWREFSSYTNGDRTSLIFCLHDAGELGVEGDIPQTHPSLLNLNQSAKAMADEKKREDEIYVFKTKVLGHFPPNIQAPLLEAFDTYMWRNEYCMPGDNMLPYHMAKWWDVTIGNEVAVEHFYPSPHMYGDHRNVGIIPDRILRTTRNFLQQTQRVDNALNTRGVVPDIVGSQWQQIISVGAHPLRRHGYLWLARQLVSTEDRYASIRDRIMEIPLNPQVPDYRFDLPRQAKG